MRADHEIGPPESDLSVTPGESRWAFSESQPKVGSGPGIHLAHNSAKLKIINLPKHYPVVKVRPLRPRQDLAGPASPAVRWSVSQCSRIRGTMVLQTQNADSIWPSRRSHSTWLAWGFAPRYSICYQVLLARVLATMLYQRGGDEETRTPDPLLAKEMLCQLSYVPRRQGSGGRYWTRTSDLCLIRAAL